MHVYKVISKESEVEELISYCKSTKYCSSDYETNGGSANDEWAYPTCLSVSFQPGSSWIIPLGHYESPFINDWERILKKFGREIIENPEIVKIGQNVKYEYQWWNRYGIKMLGVLLDSMLMKYLLDEERPHDLKSMVARFIPEYGGYDLKGQPDRKAPIEKRKEYWSSIPMETLAPYSALDSDMAFRLTMYFEKRLIKGGFYHLLRNMLMMATRVLADVETAGMYIDKDYLLNLHTTYKQKIDEVLEQLYNLPSIKDYTRKRDKYFQRQLIKNIEEEIQELRDSGASERVIANREQKLSNYLLGKLTNNKERKLFERINFGSPKQMQELLFSHKFGFNFTPFKKTDSDKDSTDEESLLMLKSEDSTGFIEALLNYRGLTKLYSTYIDGMLNKVHLDNRIHGSFLLQGTVTGRLSSREPNLQNIPRDTTSKDIKRMFICPPGKILLQMDYSQAELRVLAALSKEKTMLKWFNEGHDIHLATACKKYNITYEEADAILKDGSHKDYALWKVRRKQAKTTNFGIAYEQSYKKLADKMREQGVDVTDDEAKEFLKEWFRDFPAVKRYIEKQHKAAEVQGYVTTLFGRKRRLPKVDSDNKGERAEALRQSVNSVIQSAASDYALFSSVLIRDKIIRGELPKSLTQIGTVHDSLIYYVDPADVHEVVPKLKEIAKNPETKTWFHFEVTSVSMDVDFEAHTRSWGDLKKYNPEIDYSIPME